MSGAGDTVSPVIEIHDIEALKNSNFCLIRRAAALRASLTSLAQALKSRGSHFHVHDVHGVHTCFEVIPLSPFFSVERAAKRQRAPDLRLFDPFTPLGH